MSSIPRLTYVLPVHNEERLLRSTSLAIVDRVRTHPGSELILVENGSSDRSAQLIEELERELLGEPVRVLGSRTPKGMGYAVRRGIELSSGDLLVLTGADLPFGFSDLEQALRLLPRPPLIIGSKGHPDSSTMPGLGRRAFSWAFRCLVKFALGLGVRDSQGSILIEGPLARRICSRLTCSDYLLSTEIVAVARSEGARILEVPVVITERHRASTVRPLRDGLAMAKGVLQLRRRLSSEAG